MPKNYAKKLEKDIKPIKTQKASKIINEKVDFASKDRPVLDYSSRLKNTPIFVTL